MCVFSWRWWSGFRLLRRQCLKDPGRSLGLRGLEGGSGPLSSSALKVLGLGFRGSAALGSMLLVEQSFLLVGYPEKPKVKLFHN